MRALLSRPVSAPLFISGCAQNMAEAFPLIDLIILLSAPLAVVMDRLAGRSPSAYGHGEEERRKIADLIDLVEPQLRAAADIEIDTDRAVHATVDEILRIARAPARTATH